MYRSLLRAASVKIFGDNATAPTVYGLVLVVNSYHFLIVSAF